jgi:hypothetical protein
MLAGASIAGLIGCRQVAGITAALVSTDGERAVPSTWAPEGRSSA